MHVPFQCIWYLTLVIGTVKLLTIDFGLFLEAKFCFHKTVFMCT